jgi:predicted AlkP superfamily phosphohydrolase/phosphomutase
VAIEDLWNQGRLPNLRALAERGVATLLTPVADISPVIWTSVVTGVRPERHGITSFLLPTTQGDIPVSSTLRRVPAIWNMLSTVERRVAVLGWWLSWPAEPINGVVVSDRALRAVDHAVYPEEFGPRFEEIVAGYPEISKGDLQANIARQDEIIAAVARQLVQEDFDLILAYFRGVDVVSHPFWKYFQPPENEELDADKIERFGERVPLAYEAFDRILGDLVAAAPPESNLVVISDHGFTAVDGKDHRMLVDLNRVLEHLGYLVRVDGEISWAQTRAVTWNSPPGQRFKMIRMGLDDREPKGPVRSQDRERELARLVTELGEVVYPNGSPVFKTRQPTREELQEGAELVVIVHRRDRPSEVFFHGKAIPEVIESVEELTGTHTVDTEGVFIAAGPDIDPSFRTDAVHSLDITPTLLYLLGLPVAEDFDGRPRIHLFRSEFRQANPLKTIPSWGETQDGTATSSVVDEELIKELRALGYID